MASDFPAATTPGILGRGSPFALPRILIADNGREPIQPQPGLQYGRLLRDADLPTVIAAVVATVGPLALDIDTIHGLQTDDAAVDFVIRRLGIGIVLTRRPQTAARVAQLGCLALLHVLAFDSTGMARSLDGHPRVAGVGTVVSPGLVLPHMRPSEVEELPRPILAYGLISDPADAWACLQLADGVVLRADAAARLASWRPQVVASVLGLAGGTDPQSGGKVLTRVAGQE
jgi:Glycerol-3-phosphate responsive antiterminator (mRNA-binding)